MNEKVLLRAGTPLLVQPYHLILQLAHWGPEAGKGRKIFVMRWAVELDATVVFDLGS